MIKITGGTFKVTSKGDLILEHALVEYDEYLGKTPIGAVEAIQRIIKNNFPNINWETGNHSIIGCTFKYTVFSLENE